jgi:hypothetical protein
MGKKHEKTPRQELEEKLVHGGIRNNEETK